MKVSYEYNSLSLRHDFGKTFFIMFSIITYLSTFYILNTISFLFPLLFLYEFPLQLSWRVFPPFFFVNGRFPAAGILHIFNIHGKFSSDIFNVYVLPRCCK